MGLSIEINDTGNAAFTDGNYRAELARILRDVAKKVEAGDESEAQDGYVYDVNGNKVGTWGVDAYEDEEEGDDPEDGEDNDD